MSVTAEHRIARLTSLLKDCIGPVDSDGGLFWHGMNAALAPSGSPRETNSLNAAINLTERIRKELGE